MRRTKDNRFLQLEKKMKGVDTSAGGVYRIFEDLVKNYIQNKTVYNRDLLEAKVTEYAEYIKYGHTDLIPILFEANNALPKSKRIPMHWLFVKDSDTEDKFLVPKEMLKTPVWDYIPDSLIKKMTTKPVKFEIRPRNTGLFKIMGLIAGKDDLRPAMAGVEINDEGATATDAHKMLHISGKKDGKFPDAIYPTDAYMKRRMDDFRENIIELKKRIESPKHGDDGLRYDKKTLEATEKLFEDYKKNPTIDEKYPNWKSVLPKSSEDMSVTRVHLPFLTSTLVTLRENALLPLVTDAVEFILPQSEATVKRMGFNATLFETLTKALMMLGMDMVDLYYSEASRAMVILRAGDVWDWNNPLEKLTFGLIMPVMLGGYTNETASVKIIDDNELGVRIGDTQTKTITYASFYGLHETPKQPEKKDDDKEFLSEKITAFKTMLEVEDDAEEKKFLKEKIEAFELLQEM